MQPRDLFDWLGRDGDEIAVLSAILGAGSPPYLLHASLLLCPPEAANGWPAWREHEGVGPSVANADQVPGEFCVEFDGGIAGRAILTREQAIGWLRAVHDTGQAPPVGNLPAFRAEVAPAKAPIRVTSEVQTDAGAFCSGLSRPLTGFLFPRAVAVDDTPVPPDSWEWNGGRVFTPALALLGLSWFADRSTPMVQGLLVGRLERRAWLSTHRLTDEGFFEVGIALDPARTELADLELTVEERVNDETIWSERLRLEDVDAPKVRDEPRVRVILPSIGWGGVKRMVRLHHRDGTLLDAWRPFVMVESIHMTFSIMGPDGKSTARGPTSVIGRSGPRPELVDLLAAVQRVQAEFAAMRRAGLSARLFDDHAEARTYLRRLLERAVGQVRVLDPYFADWQLLAGLSGEPPRVLIGARVDPPEQPTGARVKRWRPSSEHSIAPFHDRFFVWDGGGVTVGTSSGARGKRFFRIDRLDAVEADELAQRFALWWDDRGFDPV